MLRTILLGVGIVSVLFALLIFSGKLPVGSKSTALVGDVAVWGTIPEESISLPISQFNAKANTYAVRYSYVPEENFNQKLLEALASGTGPDMILAPYQHILTQRERVYPFPVASFPEKMFKDTFVDGASIFFSPKGALAFPVAVDPMVLLYNRAILSKHGIVNPPKFWSDVEAITPELTIRYKAQFLESAIALGSPSVLYIKDILMAMVWQLGQTPVLLEYAPDGSVRTNITMNAARVENADATVYPLASALRFVTSFSDPAQKVFTWSDSLGRADDRFVAEKLAMYVGYSSEYRTLKARNPRGEYEMTYLPQVQGYNTFVTGMRMYGIATLKTTRNPQVAFTVQSQFSSGDMGITLANAVGGVPGLRQYALTQGLDPVIAKSMLVARGWYDVYPQETGVLISTMISDTVNRRFGVNDAANMFVQRLRTFYSSKNY